MKANFTILLVIAFGIISCQSQSYLIEWVENQEVYAGKELDKVLVSDDSGYVLSSDIVLGENVYGVKKMLNPLIEKFDSNLKLLHSLDLNKLYKSESFVFNLAGEIYVSHQTTDETQKQSNLYASKLDNNNWIVNDNALVLGTLPFKSASFPGNFKLIGNSNKSMIAVIGISEYANDDNILVVSIYSKDLSRVYDNQFELPKEKNYEIDDIHLTPDGKLNLLLANSKDHLYPEAYYFINIDTEKQFVSTEDIACANKITGAKLLVNVDNVLLINEVEQKDVNEMQIFSQMQLLNNKTASKNILSEIPSATFHSLESLQLNETITDHTGHYLFFEEDFTSDKMVYKNKKATCGNILVLKIDANGKTMWWQLIEKKQESAQTQKYLSFKAIMGTRNVNLFFVENDEFKAIVLDKMTGKVVKSNDLEQEPALLPIQVVKASKNNVLLYSKSGTIGLMQID